MSATLSIAQQILENLRKLGVEVEPRPNGKLYYSPRRVVGQRLRQLMIDNKAEILRRLNTSQNAEHAEHGAMSTPIADTNGKSGVQSSTEQPVNMFSRKLARADNLGLVAKWSSSYGFISLHDPTTGEWHDLPVKDAPAWAKREASKRKELRKHHGITRLLTALEIKKLWEQEQQAMWEHPAMTGRGIVYEDYLDNDHAKEGGA